MSAQVLPTDGRVTESRTKIRKMIGTGELMAYRIGGEFRIREEDLISVLDRYRIDPSPGTPEE